METTDTYDVAPVVDAAPPIFGFDDREFIEEDASPLDTRIAQVREITEVVITDRFRRGLATFLEELALGRSVRGACRIAGLSWARVYEVARYSPTFSDLWREAEEDGVQYLEDKAREVAVFKENPSMIIFLLKAKRPSRYRDAGAAGKVSATMDAQLLTAGPGAVKVNVNIVPDEDFVFGAEG